jgi:hypothetical protein
VIRIGEHAAVLGGSLAGLAGAAVLAQRFERVTVVERDRLPRTGRHRKGVPQGRHVHVLLPGGLRGFAAVFPGVLEDLREPGGGCLRRPCVAVYSRSPRWLAAFGYPMPSEERMHVGVHYTTRAFGKAPETSGDWRSVTVDIPPGERRGAVALAVEGDRWIVTLIGILGERPPTDLAGFLEYARTLWTRDVHAVIADAPAIGEASTGAFPANVRRRYDRLRRFPGRYIVTGDAACSLNPVYAQGMTVAFGEALTLARLLDRHGLDRVGPRFFRQTRPITRVAWSMATGADLGHPGVEGPRTARWRLLNAYIRRLFGVAHRDPVVADAALKVLGMVSPPQHLMQPRIAWRALTGGRDRGLPVPLSGQAHNVTGNSVREDSAAVPDPSAR